VYTDHFEAAGGAALYNWIGKITKDERKLRTIARWLHLIPRPFLFLLLWISGWFVYRLAANARNQVSLNMAGLLKNHSSRQIARICRSYFCNLPIILYEILIDSHRLIESKEWRFETSGEEHLEEVLREGRGAILFAPHMGNFFYYYWYLSQKYSCLTVVTAGSPELRPLYLQFQRLGCTGLDYDDTPPLSLLRTLRKHLNDNGVVMLLGDFWRPHFPRAKFFGRVTRSPGGTALLALEQQVPVIPFYGFRLERFRHKMVFGPPIRLHEEFATSQRAEATDRLNQLMESVIEQTVPEQWFYWFNANERWESRRSETGTDSGGATVA
jgi:KDO2-lipid IV(A) lauroyltransferase